MKITKQLPMYPLRRMSPVLALGFGIVLFGADDARSAAKIGTSAAVKGDVFVTEGKSGTSRRAKARQTIRLRDEVLTKQKSAIQILLLDRSIFTIGENSRLTISRFVYDPGKGSGEMAAKVLTGAFRFMSGSIGAANPANVEISTPAAALAVRGTMAEGVVGAPVQDLAKKLGLNPNCPITREALFFTLRGPGRRSNSLDTIGQAVVSNGSGSVSMSGSGFATIVPGPGCAPVQPFKLPLDARIYLDQFLRSKPGGKSVNPVELPDPVEVLAGNDNPFDPPVPDVTPDVGEGLDDISLPEPEVNREEYLECGGPCNNL